MKTITSKTAKNGATLWYVDGKRVSRDKAVEADIANGRETLSKLTAGLRADPAVYNDFGIVVEMNDILGGRYSEYFYFASAQDAVTAARKIVALGKQVHCLTIDNGRPYPANERYADTVDGKLIFLNGFERFDETDDDGEVAPVENAVTEDAFNFAVDCEIGLANLDKYKRAEGTFTHRVTKTGRHIFGGAYGFLSTDEVNERLGHYGLTVEEFLAAEYMWEVASDARMSARLFTWNLKAKIRRESKPLDEDVFNLIPTVDELNDVDDGTESDTLKAAPFDGENHTADTQTMSEIDEANWRYWEARGHKHRWLLGTGKYGETTVYFEQDGERCYAQEESEWRREAEEQLSMVYDEWEVRWYDEDEVPEPDEAYGWREVEADYYRDVL